MADDLSSQLKPLDARITTLAEQIAAGMGLEIVLVEVKGEIGRASCRERV